MQSELKLLCLHQRLTPLAAFFRLRAAGKTITDASQAVAMGSTFGDRTISSWAKDFIGTTGSPQFKISRFRMGTNRSVRSMMWDEEFRARATVWLRLNNVKKKGHPCMKLKDFQAYLQRDLFKGTRAVSKWFARTFLLSLGWHYKRHQKSVYFDGHERADVKEARVIFLKRMKEYEKRMQRYEGEECNEVRTPNLPAGKSELVLVVHDECGCHANEDEDAMYVEEGKGHALKQKSKGALLNISMFLSEERGRLRFTDREYAQFKRENPHSDLPQSSAIFMKCGAAHSTARTGKTVLGIPHDGYWKNSHVLAQIRIAVDVFEATHPGKKALFLFDNSTGHNAYVEDALIAHHMNYRPGGKQPRLRSTTWDGRPQHMTFQRGDRVCHDVKVGGETILKGTRITRESSLFDMPKGSRQVMGVCGCLYTDTYLTPHNNPDHTLHTQVSLERQLPVVRSDGSVIRHCCPVVKKTPEELFQDELLKASGHADQVTDI